MINIRKNILIVCEGKSTEPTYFAKLRDLVYDKYRKLNRTEDITIKIDPLPKQEQLETFTLREGARRRSTSNVVVQNDEPILDQGDRAQPRCYIKKAQIIGLLDQSYPDAWAVYDKDEHPTHRGAYELSKEEIHNETVNIGFSSIAFEHWILLHFEFCTHPYEKSMCRVGDVHFFCGSNTHDDDCHGARCVCGKIVSSNYLEYVGKRKEFEFNAYHPNVLNAISNALKLNNSPNPDSSLFFERNPFTNVYRLVFKLLNLPIDYKWFEFSEGFTHKGREYHFSIIDQTVSIIVSNCTDASIMVKVEDLLFIDLNGTHTEVGQRKLITPSESLSTVISDMEILRNPFLGVKISPEFVFITECPFFA